MYGNEHSQIQSLRLKSPAGAWHQVWAAPPAEQQAAGMPGSLKFCPAACATVSGSEAALPCWTRWRHWVPQLAPQLHCYPAATHERTLFRILLNFLLTLSKVRWQAGRLDFSHSSRIKFLLTLSALINLSFLIF
jgi:hypothetical protein